VILAANLAVGVGFAAAAVFPGLSVGTHWRVLFDAGIAVLLSGSLFRFYSIGRTPGFAGVAVEV
jgi:hypothetical protein